MQKNGYLMFHWIFYGTSYSVEISDETKQY
jgi:hypothetical protein